MNSENAFQKFNSKLYVLSGGKDKKQNFNIFKSEMINLNQIDDNNSHNKSRKHIFSEDLELKLKYVKDELHKLKTHFMHIDEIAVGIEGDDLIMEQILNKINEIDKKVAVIEERTKRLDELPSREEIRNIVISSIESKNIATKTDVELQVLKSRNTQILWTVGAIIAAAGIIIKFV